MWPRKPFFKRHVEQLARGSMVSGMHSIATITTEFQLQVSLYRSCRYHRESPIATIAEIEHDRFQQLQSLLSLLSLNTFVRDCSDSSDGSEYMETGLKFQPFFLYIYIYINTVISKKVVIVNS